MTRVRRGRAGPADHVRIERYAEAAWLVTFEGGPAIPSARRAQALARALHERVGPLTPIAGTASVLVPFDPLGGDDEALGDRIAALVTDLPLDPEPVSAARDHVVRVRYGGADGPDLLDVAGWTGLTPAEVVRRHGALTYEVLVLGFAPGFAYLGELDPSIQVPRLATPRPRVPAGSVGIAEGFTGIYPAALPGGWRVLGRTDEAVFDPWRAEPARFRPGDRVRFIAAP